MTQSRIIGTAYKTLTSLKDGLPGPAGVPGRPSYTWVRYADDAQGNGMSNLPAGKDYIGIATNKETPIESDDASLYSWSLFKGSDGVAGKPGSDGKTYYTWIKYADTPTSGMSDSPEGKDYMGLAHNKETAKESDRYEDYQWSLIRGPQGLQGLQGEDGKDGIPGEPGQNGMTTYFHIKYSALENPQSSADMSETPNTYIGTYTDYTKQDSDNPRDYMWARFQGIQGPAGENGIPGKPGPDGRTSYLHIKYSNVSNPTRPEQMNEEGGEYIGQYVDFIREDSQDPRRYTWSRIKGDQGVKGDPVYTWIRYANDEFGNGMSNSPVGKAYIGMAFNKTTSVESDRPGDYKWSRLKGDQGLPGNPGSDGKTLYTWIKYSKYSDGRDMTDNPEDMVYIGLAHNKEQQKEGTNPKDYQWTKIKGDQGLAGPQGPDGTTLYTWIKYSNYPDGREMSDDPEGMSYIGIAYNKREQTEGKDPRQYTWTLFKGPKGEDGDIGDFPDSLPKTPVLKGRVSGISTMILNWTFEDKIYYKYELYGSRMPNFDIRTENLLYEGNAIGSHIFQAAPGETWYFTVRVKNSHGRAGSTSNKLTLACQKIDNMDIIAGNGAIKDALIDNLNANKITAGQISTDILKANVIDAVNATIGNATIDKAKIGDLSADKITAGDISADRITASVINAINANIGKATIDSAKIGDLSADKITTGTLDADRIKAGSIEADKLSVGAINASAVKADEIISNKIKTGEIKVTDANIIDGTISGAKISEASISNAQISKAFIADGYIKSLVADKIKGGTLDAKNMTVTNLNADSITVGKINGKQIASGTIGYDNLEDILESGIKNTITNVDQVMKDMGIVKVKVESTVKSVVEYFAINDSSSKPPVSGWSTNPPTWSNGKFIWKKTITTTTDGTTAETAPVCITGAKGEKGNAGAAGPSGAMGPQGPAGSQGIGIASVDVEYYLSTSNSSQTGGSWSTTAPDWIDGRYMWSRTVTRKTDGTSTTSKPVCITGGKGATGPVGSAGPSGAMGPQGPAGSRGPEGQGIASIVEEYYLSTSKTTQSGGSWVTTAPTWTVGKYMWTRSKITYKNPTSTAYTTPVCDSSWEAVNEIEIGGRNLILRSYDYSGSDYKKDSTTVLGETYGGTKIVETSVDWGSIDIEIRKLADRKVIKAGDTITYSVYARLVGSGTKDLRFYLDDNAVSGQKIGELTNQWKKYERTFTLGQKEIDNSRRARFETFNINGTGIKFQTACHKFELGNKSTSWTPAPEDADNDIKKVDTIAKSKSTVYYATNPPSADGKRENDVWFDTDDGYKMYRFTGGKWIQSQFGQGALGPNSITAGHIVGGTITGDKIAGTTITGDKISSNTIDTGQIKANAIKASQIDANAVTADKILAGSIQSSKLDVEELFGDNAFFKNLKALEIDAANITTGTISNERINIKGMISFESFNQEIANCFQPDPVHGKTYINGGMIAADSIKANQIDTKGLIVKNKKQEPTLAISQDGDIKINGLLQSGNFNQEKKMGYSISTDGKAILNQAEIRGDVKLPNAGITNYGGSLGNDNLATGTINSVITVGKNVSNQTIPIGTLNSSKIFGKKFTISFEYECTPKATGLFWGQTGNNHYQRLTDQFDISKNPRGRVVNTLTFQDNGKTFDTIYIRADNLNGTLTIKNVKVEYGDEATPWCPAPNEVYNPVRFWAGESYENRDRAPFTVRQNGDIFANNVDLSGRMFGTIDNGNLRIDKGTITISNGERSLLSSGEIVELQPRIYKEYIKLSDSIAKFDVNNVVIGDNEAVFSRDKLLFETKNIDFKANASMGTLLVSKESGELGGVNILGPSGGRHIIRGSNSEGNKGALVLDSQGTKASRGDFIFSRMNDKENCKVNIRGELNVKEKINSSANKIEMKAFSDGWGFYLS